MNQFKSWGRVSSLILGVVILFGISKQTQAETRKELEDRILQGSQVDEAPPTSTSPLSTSGDASTQDEKSSTVDVEVPELKESTDDLVKERDLKAIEDAIKGPSEIPQSHIMVVQRRYIHKEGRHEFIPAMIGLQPADSFRRQVEFGFGYVYHLTESIGIEFVHANVVSNFSTGLSNTIRSSTGLETDRIEPVLTLGSTLQWTPLRSKAGAYTSIHYFEGFFLAGGGMSRYENQTASMAMWGVGFRIYLTKFAILKTEVRDYIDFKSGGTDYRFNILTGIGVLLGSGQ